MIRICFALLLLISGACTTVQSNGAPNDEAALRALLVEFLAGAGRNDATVHDRFWAEDLIYTTSSGRRMGKGDIMRGFQTPPTPQPDAPETVYTAEDVRVQQYGDTAVVAFRLVATTTKRGATLNAANFLNSGTFLKRGGVWQVVNWQATRVPVPQDAAIKEVAAVDAAFHRAILESDVAKLESLLDETFIRTFRDGSQQSRSEAVEELRSNRLEFTKIESSNVTVHVYGDAAVVRGMSSRQRSAVPGAGADGAPFFVGYTMTLIRKDGAWKIVALHTSHA